MRSAYLGRRGRVLPLDEQISSVIADDDVMREDPRGPEDTDYKYARTYYGWQPGPVMQEDGAHRRFGARNY